MSRCFADNFEGKKGCSALTIKKCTGYNFYRTEKQVIKSREKALKRIKSLDTATRFSIANTYELEV